MSYNGTNRRIKADETRQKIYQSAERLFTEHDPDGVSVDAIVKAAGVSKGSFYVHFASKDALFMELITERVAMVDADYQSWLDAMPDETPAGDVLLSLVGRITDVLTENIGVEKMITVYKAQLAGEAGVGAVGSDSRELYGMFRSVIERGIKRGEFKTDIPLDNLTRHMMLAIRGVTYEWCIRYPDFDYKAEAARHFQIILAGLSPFSG